METEKVKKEREKHMMMYYGMIIAYIIYIIVFFYLKRNAYESLSAFDVGLNLAALFLPLMIFAYFFEFISFSLDKMVFNERHLFYLVMFIFLILAWSMFPSDDFWYKFFTKVEPLPYVSDETSYLIRISLKLVGLAISLVGLAIFYNVFLNEGYRRSNSFIYLLFFIPCLITVYFKYLFQEFKTTPVVVYALIFIELILILLYVYLPRLFRKMIITEGTQLIDQPLFLTSRKVISNIEPFYELSTSFLETKNIRRNYCIAMWLSFNHPTFGEETMIFRFGLSTNDAKSGSPYLACTKEGKLKIIASNNATAGDEKEFNVPLQRWNYIVMNYHENNADLFINGELTHTFVKNLPTYTNEMNVVIGTDSKRLHGAICNLIVYPRNLNLTEITQSYNILKLVNPPVNNLY